MSGIRKERKVEKHSKISRLRNWMQYDDATNQRDYKWKDRIQQAEKTDSASRYDEIEVPLVHHLGGARIAGNWKLRSRIQKRI